MSIRTIDSGSEPHAEIPVVVEAWARPAASDASRGLCQPHTGRRKHPCDPRQARDQHLRLRAAPHRCDAPKDKHLSSGSTSRRPTCRSHRTARSRTLYRSSSEITSAMTKAVRKAHRPNAGSKRSHKDVVLDNLDDVIADVSGEEGYRFNMRQLFYGLRPIVMTETGEELKLGNFTSIITDYEERERRHPADVPGASRRHHASASGRDNHARHPDGRGIRTACVDIQQAGLHREGRCQRGAERSGLG